MLPQDCKKQKTAANADDDAANFTQLPSDVLSGIFLCLPASDLRRLRRICKEWRDIISDLSFIDAHMVHGPRAPTQTIVFYSGRRQANSFDESVSSGGFLFDEQWRFTINGSADMIGTCKGLLCFRDSEHSVIKVVEPFTGEGIALPLPPTAHAGTCTTTAYRFGFDATARRYKIVHGVFEGKVNYDGYFFGPSMGSAVKQEPHVFTVGVDREWRTMGIRGARHGMLYGDPACDDGAIYWYSLEYNTGFYRNVRFDPATERITSERRRLVRGMISCRYSPLLFGMHTIGIRWFGEVNLEDSGCWSKNIDTMAHETFDTTRSSRYSIPGRHALQRGYLLLMEENDGVLRAHPILRSSVSSLDIGYTWDSKPLIVRASMKEKPAEQYPVKDSKFVAMCHDSSKVEVPIIGPLPSQHRDITAFPYIPTVSPPPFALYSLRLYI